MPAAVILLMACRATPTPEPAPSPASASVVPAVSVERSSEPPRTELERSYQPASERSDASGSPCEWSCGDVHDCALVTGDYTPSAAASIEIGCLGTCLATPERVTLFGCGRPATIEPGSCSPFLDCVAASWPDELLLRTPVEIGPTGDGCLRACTTYGRCFNTMTEPEDVTRCAEMCRQSLDGEGQRRVGECAKLPSCMEIMRCVNDNGG